MTFFALYGETCTMSISIYGTNCSEVVYRQTVASFSFASLTLLSSLCRTWCQQQPLLRDVSWTQGSL